MTTERFLIVGLGNPGREYRLHRHNIGFMLLDKLALANGLVFSRVQHQALVVKGQIGEKQVVLAKPQTFMNESGVSVARLVRFFEISLDSLLVAYDDLDLPLGVLRFRESGGSGGHRGMRSIINALESNDFPRMRLGIGRPPGRMDPARYVLRPFKKDEIELRDMVLEEAMAGLSTFFRDHIKLAMSRHNGAIGSLEKDNLN